MGGVLCALWCPALLVRDRPPALQAKSGARHRANTDGQGAQANGHDVLQEATRATGGREIATATAAERRRAGSPECGGAGARAGWDCRVRTPRNVRVWLQQGCC